ncbi:MAG: DUF2796 domain-containing protein [Gammaproteobacteria bacterium]|nr:DUF2796 domain-containing protein [Gammaproteobacteria bacterium]
MNKIVAWLAAGLLSGCFGVGWAHEAEHEEEHREHDAHVHGVANLDLAVESNQLMAELRAPAMNIVGFEHAPRNDEQRRAVEQAAAWLKDGEQWLILPAAAACRPEASRVASSLLDTGDADSHDHDSHDHDSHDDDVHSELHVHLAFHCASPDELRRVEIRLFEQFPGMERIDLQAVTAIRQIGGALTAGDAVINLAE